MYGASSYGSSPYGAGPLSAAATPPAIGTAEFTLPALTVYASAHDSTGEYSAVITLPKLTLAAYGGANAVCVLPALAVTITGTSTNWGRAAFSLPSLSASGAGTVTTGGSAAITLPMFSVVGYTGAVLSATLGGVTVAATGTTGGVASITARLPMLVVEATGTAQNRGGANITLPAVRAANSAVAWLMLPGLRVTATGTAVVAATYEAYALNLNHSSDTNDEVTHYTNFPFTHVVRYKNSYYGANSTGLYLLDGTTDDSVPIAWSMKTAFTDFDTDYLKNISMAYFGGRLGPNATIGVVEGESGEFTYSYSTPRGSTAQNYRQPFGKGLRARYYAIFAGGSDVATIDSITFNIAKSARKV